MPARDRATLPEASLISQLARDANKRVARMIAPEAGAAASFLPAEKTLFALEQAARGCAACDLCTRATQTVFGAGNPRAKLVLVGEQPGDEEDLRGHPFVGPARRILDEALHEAGIVRDSIYVTNAVKHFKF